MKNLLKWLVGIIIVLVIVVILLVLFGKGFGLGNGTGNGDGEDGRSVADMSFHTDTKTDASIVDKSIEAASQVEPSETIVMINVVERDYYYNNERVSLDQFIEKIKSIEGRVVVEIKDDNAALKTYNELVDRLDQEKINHIESDK